MCGEKRTSPLRVLRTLGSPPRMRGKEQTRSATHQLGRITPAYAGKRSEPWPTPCPAGDHPRVCREKRRNSRDPEVGQGSPPPVRGKDTAVQREPFLAGIPPPPRMQGKGNFHVVTHTKVGITPARAGKSCPPQAPTFTRQDHPRVCGEKFGAFRSNAEQPGSPPRMRGKALCGQLQQIANGITPAYAGKRSSEYLHTTMFGDHPRVCGEKKCRSLFLFIYRGSPPRMRGKGFTLKKTGCRHGITPAYAGKRSRNKKTDSGL